MRALFISDEFQDVEMNERRVSCAEARSECYKMDRSDDESGCVAKLAVLITDSTFQNLLSHVIFVLAIRPINRDLRKQINFEFTLPSGKKETI